MAKAMTNSNSSERLFPQNRSKSLTLHQENQLRKDFGNQT